MPPRSTPVPLGQARSLLATKRFQTNISGWSAMSLLRLLLELATIRAAPEAVADY
jgi:hypothetical protein